MPALSGSDRAYKQNRSGIARAGTTRAGYFTQNLVVTINGTSVVIDRNSLRVRLALNDEPDTAEFRMPVVPASTPTAGQAVVIGLGTAANRIFAGQIEIVRHVRYRAGQSPRFWIRCVDWSALFNRQLVTYGYEGYTATAIAQDLVTNHTSGFTGYGIASGLDTIAEMVVAEAEPPGVLFRRVANRIAGGYRIDPYRDVHLWGSGGETGPRAPTSPTTITETLATCEQFGHEYDFSQIRNRVIVEGNATSCPLSIPAGVTLPGVNTLPVEDSTAFSTSGGDARIGTQRVTYTSRNYPVVSGLNAEGARVTADVAAGATSVSLNDATWVIATGTSWCQIGDQIVYFAGSSGGGPTNINTIPTSGFGSIQHAIGTGESVRALGMLVGVSGLTLAQEAGVEVAVQGEADDTSSQTAIAAIEGGDGIHEYIVVDGRYNADGCVERAEAELDLGFTEALLRCSWVTYDMNAVPGTQQVINIAGTGALSATVTVESVLIDFPSANRPPRRTCQGSIVKVARAIDALIGL
jgi:hypothetical protein